MKQRQTLKTRWAAILLALLLPSAAFALTDGDTFTVNTTEGVTMTFQVISTTSRTCRVYGDWGHPSIESTVSGKVTIPSVASGYSVVEISDYAFFKCQNLTTVSMPNSIKTIGAAFYGCTSLAAISGIGSVENITSNYAFDNTPWYANLPNGMINIGKVAFQYKGTMPENTTITIEDGIVSIGPSAFGGQVNLVGITIPESLTIINDKAFRGCRNLSIITVSPENKTYDSRNNCNAIIRTADNTLVVGGVNTPIMGSVKKIARHAFYGINISSINTNLVETIEEYAFDASALKSVHIGGVKNLYNKSFYSCSNLQSITVSSDNYNLFAIFLPV